MALQQSIPENSIEVNKAFLTPEDASELFCHLYDMPKPTSVRQIDGYDTQNFLIKIEDEFTNNADVTCNNDTSNDSACTKYVLKLMSGEDSKEDAGFRIIHNFQKYLKERNYVNAAPMQNIYGDDLRLEIFCRVQPKDAVHHPGKRIHGQFLIRAYPFIEGVNLGSVIPANSIQVFYEAGKSLARLHQILEKFNDNIEPLKKKAETFDWSLDQLNITMQHVDLVKDESRRNMVQDVIHTFDTSVLSRKDEFRKGIVHNDFSHTNTVVAPETTTHKNHIDSNKCLDRTTNYKFSGVLDFDDAQYNCFVFDVGISMMYFTLSKAGGNQPIHASAAFLAGYQCINPLTKAELEVLHICQAARFIQSLLLGLYTYSLQPGNEYLLETQVGWPILEKLWGMDVDELWKIWEDVANECATKFENNRPIARMCP